MSNVRRMLLNSLFVVGSISVAGGVTHLATFSHAGTANAVPIAVASGVTALGCIPPLWLSALLSNGPACQLAVVTWRLGILLPSLLLTESWQGEERNCFIIALLACYFVALPLESWLLIRDLAKTAHVKADPSSKNDLATKL